MRLLLKEQPYEKRIAAGALRYEREGQPTGAVEHWRYTNALDGYRFLRVDLDGRESSGDTFLYRVLLNRDGHLEDIRWRFYNANFHAGGQVLFEDGYATAVREVRDERFEEEVALDDAMFFFPTVMGLWVLNEQVGHTAVTLNMHNRDTADFMKLVTFPAQLMMSENQYQLIWADQWRKVQLGDHGFPVQMARPDALIAIEQRLVQYG